MKPIRIKRTPPTTPNWHTKARALGCAVRFSFLRIIRKETGCSEPEAIKIFDQAVTEGLIVKTCHGSVYVPIWEMK